MKDDTDLKCDRCGYRMLVYSHCKLICNKCGQVRDCSDT